MQRKREEAHPLGVQEVGDNDGSVTGMWTAAGALPAGIDEGDLMELH